jgi:HEAT repeat protein
MKPFTLLLLPLALGLCGLSSAGQPAVVNAKLTTHAHSGSLSDEVRRVTGPAWIGYAMPAAKPEGNSCCWNDRSRGCSLEGGHGVTANNGASAKPVKLEGSKEIAVLMRVERGEVGKVHVFSIDCELDAGGLPFIWLTGVGASESAAHLKGLAPKGALVALALQGGKEAETALIELARDAQTGHRRGEALFWLAQRASDKAIGAIGQAIENDPDTGVRKQAVFALSQLPKDEGVPKLIDVARSNRNPAVRKQAFFWLGQSRDPRAFRFLEETLTR